jgi:hypothetical protein
MKFPKPWKIEQTGHSDCVVYDANGSKLFHIVGDEGDGEEAEPSMLFWSDDSDDLLNEVVEMVGMLE